MLNWKWQALALVRLLGLGAALYGLWIGVPATFEALRWQDMWQTVPDSVLLEVYGGVILFGGGIAAAWLASRPPDGSSAGF